MGYCISSILPDKSIQFNILNKIDLNIHKNSNIQKVIDNTIEFLESILYEDIKLSNDDEIIVLIECQMTSIMKTIQTTINTFFKTISRYENIPIKTIYLSPKHKLNIINIDTTPTNSNYKQNKLDSISFSIHLLQNKYKHDDFLAIINSHKKKDDICDAFLMSIYYYENFIHT
jgi:antitoxin component of RelBE/YafQ-DinJ toxin-antitoxin module